VLFLLFVLFLFLSVQRKVRKKEHNTQSHNGLQACSLRAEGFQEQKPMEAKSPGLLPFFSAINRD